jgi:hypothetical protein
MRCAVYGYELAGEPAAAGTFVSDQSRLASDRRNRYDIFHCRAAIAARWAALSRRPLLASHAEPHSKVLNRT